MADSVTQTLAGFASGLSIEAIPEAVREDTKKLVLDTLACAIAGHQGEETAQLGTLASALAESGEASVIGGDRLSLAGSTLFNGYLITAVTMCDVHRATLTHITPEIVPPALAIAERDAASGSDLLVAIAAGCEVTTRVGIGLDYAVFRAKGWHGPGVIGPFGAAAAVGSLRGFDADTMARAFGLAGSQSAGTFAAWGTPTVKFHQCRAALSGLMAALLAETDFVATRDFLTAPDGGLYNTYVDGGLPDVAVADLGARWELQQIALRPWPAASLLQGEITALFDLVARHDVAFDDIERVDITLGTTPFDMHGGFATYRAKFEALLSAHYVAAVFLRDRALTLSQFEPECYDDPVLRRFAAEDVKITADASLVGVQATAAVTTRAGDVLTAHCEHPLGAPENPLSWDQVADKFRTYARARLPEDRVEETIDAVARLEEIGSARTLLDLVREAGTTQQARLTA